MPKRPRAHVIEDLARAHLLKACSSLDWTVEFLNKDYGEDALVRIFEFENATPWAFYVQLKSTDNLETYVVDDGDAISYPIKADHAEHWNRFWEPVILVVYDARSNTSYWEIVQDFLKRRKNAIATSGTLSVRVPKDHILNEEGLRRIAKRTKRRFARFKDQEAGAAILIEEIEQAWGVKIVYEPHGGLLEMPKGRFVPSDSGGSVMIVFGRLKALLQGMSEKEGLPPLDFLVKIARFYVRERPLHRAKKGDWRENIERYLDKQSDA
jgi:hypothetical protein